MLKMPTIHTPPPVPLIGSWQHTTMPLDHFAQPAKMMPPAPAPAQRPGFFGSLACTMLLTSFLALSGCDYIEKLVGKKKPDPAPMALSGIVPKTIPESAFVIGTSRKVKRRPKGKYAKRLERQAYTKAWKSLRRMLRKEVRAKYPVDCRHARKFTQELDWEHSKSLPLRDARGRYYYRYQLLWRSATCIVRKSVARGRAVELSFTIHNPVLR